MFAQIDVADLHLHVLLRISELLCLFIITVFILLGHVKITENRMFWLLSFFKHRTSNILTIELLRQKYIRSYVLG